MAEAQSFVMHPTKMMPRQIRPAAWLRKRQQRGAGRTKRPLLSYSEKTQVLNAGRRHGDAASLQHHAHPLAVVREREREREGDRHEGEVT